MFCRLVGCEGAIVVGGKVGGGALSAASSSFKRLKAVSSGFKRFKHFTQL